MSMHPQQSTQVVVHPAFELVRQRFIDALNINVFECRHKTTGAIHYHLASDNSENVFLVAFRTQPMDNTGTAHILEHTVLCGSQKYPVRDPFFMMLSRSLNTFMNAFTAADWTCYPFATQNRKDFDNLLSVYLDAVFFANLNALDFAQEGIRVELEEGHPVFKGVVFNEMKGALSAANDQLYHSLAHHLYPTTTYHYNSGGDPKHIPDLSHAQLLAFYRSHYHPSNAVLMTFGDASLYELQDKFEQQALQHFSRGQTLYSVAEQRLSQPLRVQESYAFDGSDLNHKSYHVLAWLLPETTNNIQIRLGMRLVEGILMEDSAAPLRNYLETSKLGRSIGPFMGIDDSNYELTFYCGIQESQAESAAAFEQGVLDKLAEIAAQPIDPTAIEAILHQIELHQREVSGDGTPYGLSLLLNGLTGAIHHGDPIGIWDVDAALADIRQHLADPMWLSQLIQTYLIDNPHRVCLSLVPDNQQSAREQAVEQARLDQLAAQLDDQQRQQLQAQSEALKLRQATADDQELLPKVSLHDIPAQLKHIDSQLHQLQLGDSSAPLHLYHAGTNGLYYQQVLIHLPQELACSPYLTLLCILMGEIGAADQDYLELQQQQTAISGGIGMGLSVRSQLQAKDQISSLLTLTTKALHQHPQAMELLHQAFNQMRFDEKSRIIELLQQRKAQWLNRISQSAHSYAMQIASRQMSAFAQRDYHISGFPALRWFSDLVDQISVDEQAYAQLIQQLQALHQQLRHAPKSFLLVCEAQHSAAHLAHLTQVWQDQTVTPLPAHAALPLAVDPEPQLDQAWLIQSNVQFCASAYPAVDASHPDAAAFMVLGAYLRNNFLHSAIREQGGAYGGGAGYDGNSCAFRFYSYRDPRLSETFVDFKRSLAWLFEQQHPAHLLEEAILGLIASMDKPGSPAGEAVTHCYTTLHGRTHQFRQQLRQQLLAVSLDDLQRITQHYLLNTQPTRAVVAPFHRQEELQALGFAIHRIED
jgi:Zn-dependent M16 (insulinase) family peptidase